MSETLTPGDELDGPAGADVRALDSAAQHLRTPSGNGHMVWRSWGHGDPLVLLHGGYGSWAHWLRNIVPLSQRYRVIAADLPGLGDSDMPDDATSERVIDIVTAGLRTVTRGQRCHLVGFSFGSLVGGGVAAACGDELRSFTMVGGGPLFTPRRPRLELQRVVRGMGSDEIAAIQRTNLSLLMLHNRTSIDATAVAIQTRNTRVAQMKSIGFFPPDWLNSQLPRVTAPLGAIWGEFDATAYPELDQREQALRSLRPDAPFRMIPDVGHWVQYEAAAAFNEALLERLSSV